MKNNMFEKTRLETFSDGVIAIIITIMVIEFRPPGGTNFSDIIPLIPTFLAYALSFLFLAIYWNNHHHLMRAAKGVNGKIMWSNMGLLFCLTLIPFATAWMGENFDAPAPIALYGVVMLASAISYLSLQRSIFATLSPDSPFVRAVGADYKGKLSLGIYTLAFILIFVNPRLAQILYVLIVFLWIVPDKRLEQAVNS